MSRSGYNDDCWGWDLIRWRGAVASAIRGKRGQSFLKEMLSSLDKLENKRLIREDLLKEGEVCALGSVGVQRGLDMTEVDPYDHETVANLFNIPHSLACEIMYENDEIWYNETPEQRYERVRKWIEDNIAP